MIAVQNISKVYGEQYALDQVSLEVSKGEVVGLLGPNGAGKSTLMKILACVIPPSSGTARIAGLDVSGQALEVRKKVGYLPELNPLYPELYVKEYLSFIASLHKLTKKKERIAEVIAMTGLGSEAHKKIGQLSKGFRQRVGLAQAMIHDPEILILDEPTSGLDPNQLVEIRKLISELGKEKTILLSTHIMQEVEAICKRALIIHHGNLIADELTSKLIHMFEKQSLLRVQFGKQLLADDLALIDGVANVRALKDGYWEIEADSGQDIRQKLLQNSIAKGWDLLSLQLPENKLEDVFQQLTSGEKKNPT